jgi:hypothetical protein
LTRRRFRGTDWLNRSVSGNSFLRPSTSFLSYLLSVHIMIHRSNFNKLEIPKSKVLCSLYKPYMTFLDSKMFSLPNSQSYQRSWQSKMQHVVSFCQNSLSSLISLYQKEQLDNEFSSLDVAVSAWEHRQMKLQLRNDSISTYLHAIEIYPHGGLPVILPTQYVLLVPCAVSSCSLNFVQIEYNVFSLYTSVYVFFLSALLNLHVLSCSLINFIHFTSNHIVPEQITWYARTIHSENIQYCLCSSGMILAVCIF